MKTISKLTGALSLAATMPVLAQEMVPLDDTNLGMVTGQTEITIKADVDTNLDALINGAPVPTDLVSTSSEIIPSDNQENVPPSLLPKAMTVNIDDTNLDIDVGGFEMGGASMGTAAIRDLNMGNTAVTVYKQQ